jgi:DNA-binding protein HU-beta
MNKQDLVKRMAEDLSTSQAGVERFLSSLQSTIMQLLKEGEQIALSGFLNISPVARKAFTARNPQTGAPIKVPAKNIVKIKAGSLLSGAVK